MKKAQIAIIVIGVIGMVLVLFAPMIGLSKPGFGTGKLTVLIFCIGLICVGIVGSNITKLYTSLAIIFLTHLTHKACEIEVNYDYG